MCGIVVAVVWENIIDVLIEGLMKLDYRGYDSARLAVSCGQGMRCLHAAGRVADWVRRFADKGHPIFLGRSRHFPIALEGALKLKELPYIDAEAYAAGDLYVFADADSRIEESDGVHLLHLPEHCGLLSPVLHVMPL